MNTVIWGREANLSLQQMVIPSRTVRSTARADRAHC